MEAPPGFEPGMEVLQTSALPLGDGAARTRADRRHGLPGRAGRCGGTHQGRIKWSGKRDSNPRLRPWQGRTLPLSYSRSHDLRKVPYHTPSAASRQAHLGRNGRQTTVQRHERHPPSPGDPQVRRVIGSQVPEQRKLKSLGESPQPVALELPTPSPVGWQPAQPQRTSQSILLQNHYGTVALDQVDQVNLYLTPKAFTSTSTTGCSPAATITPTTSKRHGGSGPCTPIR